MAASSLAIDTDEIVTIECLTTNSASDLNTTHNEIVTKFNAMAETSTGHHHDGTDSRLLSGSSFSSADLLMMQIGGGIS